MAYVLTLIYIAITLLSPGVFPPEVAALHLSEIFGIFIILIAVWDVGESNIASRPETYLGIGLLASSTMSTLATGWFGGALTVFLNFLPIIFTFYFVAITCTNLRRIKIMVYVMVAVAIFIFAQGFIAEHTNNFTSPYLLSEVILDMVDYHFLYRYRGLGVISDPNDLAQLFVMLIPLLWLRWKKGSTFANFMLTIVPATILATGVYYTHSRGGSVALVAVVLFGFKDKIGVIGSTVVAAVAMIGLVALGLSGGRGIGDDDGGRVALWGEGLQMLKSHFILGIGPGNFSDKSSNGLTAHNSFILGMVELGLVGYFFWMGMITSSWLGLSEMIPSKEETSETSAYASNRMRFPAGKKALSAVARLVETPAQMPGVLQHSMANRGGALIAPAPTGFGTWVPTRYVGSLDKDPPPTPEELAYAAKIIRIGFVGLLTAGFFLSRTYSVGLYIMLGMAVAVIKMRVPLPVVDVPALLKKIAIACIISLVLLYAVIRIHPG